MFVVIKGDFRLGVTHVVGPFETEEAVTSPKTNPLFHLVQRGEIYEVTDTGRGWDDRAIVNIRFDNDGQIAEIKGPFEFSLPYEIKNACSRIVMHPRVYRYAGASHRSQHPQGSVANAMNDLRYLDEFQIENEVKFITK